MGKDLVCHAQLHFLHQLLEVLREFLCCAYYVLKGLTQLLLQKMSHKSPTHDVMPFILP